jgi:hypothetical protein
MGFYPLYYSAHAADEASPTNGHHVPGNANVSMFFMPNGAEPMIHNGNTTGYDMCHPHVLEVPCQVRFPSAVPSVTVSAGSWSSYSTARHLTPSQRRPCCAGRTARVPGAGGFPQPPPPGRGRCRSASDGKWRGGDGLCTAVYGELPVLLHRGPGDRGQPSKRDAHDGRLLHAQRCNAHGHGRNVQRVRSSSHPTPVSPLSDCGQSATPSR